MGVTPRELGISLILGIILINCRVLSLELRHIWYIGSSNFEYNWSRVGSSCPDLAMSKTVGGRSARLTTAASGSVASISSLVSWQAAHGWGCTGPGLSPPAILPSLTGSVNDTFFVSPEACQSKVRFLLAQRAIQRRSLDEIAEEQVRRGQIRRRSLDEI